MKSIAVALLVMLGAFGCDDPPKEDGGQCSKNDDCKNNMCQANTCVGGPCNAGMTCPTGFECAANVHGTDTTFGCDMLCTDNTCPFPGFHCAGTHCNLGASLTDPDDPADDTLDASTSEYDDR